MTYVLGLSTETCVLSVIAVLLVALVDNMFDTERVKKSNETLVWEKHTSEEGIDSGFPVSDARQSDVARHIETVKRTVGMCSTAFESLDP